MRPWRRPLMSIAFGAPHRLPGEMPSILNRPSGPACFFFWNNVNTVAVMISRSVNQSRLASSDRFSRTSLPGCGTSEPRAGSLNSVPPLDNIFPPLPPSSTSPQTRLPEAHTRKDLSFLVIQHVSSDPCLCVCFIFEAISLA